MTPASPNRALLEFMRDYLSSPLVINKRYTIEYPRKLVIDGGRALPENIPNCEPRPCTASATMSKDNRELYDAEHPNILLDTKVMQVIATKDQDVWKLSNFEHFHLLEQFDRKVFDRLYTSIQNEYKLINCDVVCKIQTNKLIKSLTNRCDHNKVAELAAWLTELYYARRKVIHIWMIDHVHKLPF